MDFDKINLENIDIFQNNSNFYSIKYNNDKLEIKINNVEIPYGLENEYGKLILKMNLIDKCLVKKIKDIEELITHKFKLNIKTQLRNDSLLTCKIPTIKNKIICDIKKNNSYFNIYNLKRKDYITACIYIDKIWLYKSNYYYKWNFKFITLI